MGAATTVIRLRVTAGARRSGIAGRHGPAWKLRVAAPAERRRANEAMLDLLSASLDVPRRSLSLVAGHAARDKIVELEGLAADEVERRLAAAGKGS